MLCLLPILDPSLNLMTSESLKVTHNPLFQPSGSFSEFTQLCHSLGFAKLTAASANAFVTTWCPDFPGLSPPSHPGFLARFLLPWQPSVERCFKPCSILPSFLYLPTPQKKASSHTVLSTMEFWEIRIHKY